MSALHTSIDTKGSHGLLGLALKVQCPSFIGLGVGCSSTLHRHLILAGHGLPVEDEERYDPVCLPLVQVIVDVVFDTRQATERGEERFMGRGIVEEKMEVIRGIYSN
jgi:hypothetical protein